MLPWLVGFQVCATAAVTFLPFGFDVPSELGLDFGHFLALGALYSAALLIGTSAAFLARNWASLAIQLALPAMLAALLASGRLAL
jgi:hypothetical protein